MQRALNVPRTDFPEWYQAVVRDADMAETSPVRGCMIIKPWGYGVWERIQRLLDQRIRDTGHENAYFPLFIPMSFIAKEAEHVAGFAKEMAVVTHHRLKVIDGKLQPDPDAKLEEPMIVRPTSETIIGDAFSRWIKSHRDLPVLINQWANVVRWEMRTRLFLRTAEFLWQEGHTAHATADEALAETMKMLEVYREFAEGPMAMPVMAGEKPANERFPGAVSTFSIEAMMQDGKALQAGTSHYLGQHFAEAQNIRFQNDAGEMAFCHTTSWGVSTRLIGGLIMTHGDDDGLRLPPALAPQQIVIVPMLRGKPEDGALLEYCDAIAKELKGKVCLGETIRAQVDTKSQKSAEKRWNWVRRGAPIIVEIGGRDMANGTVTFMRRDTLRDGDKVISHNAPRDEFINKAADLLTEIQNGLFNEAKAKRDAAIVTGITSYDDLVAYFSGDENATKGWVKASWARPEGAELEAIAEKLKALKLTLRNAPLDQPSSHGKCLFTGRDGVEEIFVARAY
ncbi:MAG: proline--tRNA ligase [Rhizomicrobium sp.]